MHADTVNGITRTGLAILLLALFSAAAMADLSATIDHVRASVVGIGKVYPVRQPNRREDPIVYLATGFVVADGRHVVTNTHVIPAKLDSDHNQTLAVFSGRGADAQAHRARVVRTDETHDLALLAFDGPALPALALDDSDAVREGREIAFTGFPIGIVLGLYPVTHRGIVSAITPMARPVENARTLNAVQLQHLRQPFDAFQLDAVAYPGNSGSPVYDVDSGRVLAVVNSVFVKESRESVLQRPSGISYAIPINHVKPLLAGIP